MKIRKMKFAQFKIIGLLSLTLGIVVGSSLAQEITINKQVFGNQHGEFMLPTFDLITTGAAIDAKPVKGAPFAAEFASESVQTLADNNRIVRRSTSLFYRDSEGRTRREQTHAQFGNLIPNGLSDNKQILIFDPVTSSSYSLSSLFRTAHRSKIFSVTVNASDKPPKGINGLGVKPPKDNAAFKIHNDAVNDPALKARLEEMSKALLSQSRPQMEKPREEFLGTRDFEGVSAEGKRVTTVLPAGYMGNEKPIEIVRETWFSKELQIVVMTNTKNPLTGEQTYKIIKLERAEQPRALFEVPADYKIIDGTKMFNRLFYREPGEVDVIVPFNQLAPDNEKHFLRLERLSN